MRVVDSVIIDLDIGTIYLPLGNFKIKCTHSNLFPSGVKIKYK